MTEISDADIATTARVIRALYTDVGEFDSKGGLFREGIFLDAWKRRGHEVRVGLCFEIDTAFDYDPPGSGFENVR